VVRWNISYGRIPKASDGFQDLFYMSEDPDIEGNQLVIIPQSSMTHILTQEDVQRERHQQAAEMHEICRDLEAVGLPILMVDEDTDYEYLTDILMMRTNQL
jgi:hypothetical protein